RRDRKADAACRRSDLRDGRPAAYAIFVHGPCGASEVLRRIASFVLRPPLVGALYMIAQAARAAIYNVQDDQSLGDASQAREIHSFIYGQYGKEITRIGVAIVLAAAVIGAAIGGVAGLLVLVRDRIAQRRAARSPQSLALQALWITMVLHGL